MFSSVFRPQTVEAANQITSRSLTLQAGGAGGAGDAGAKIGGTVRHEFNFTVPSVGNASVGSIQFLYCTTADEAGACTTPTNLSTTGATLEYQTPTLSPTFTMVNTTNGAPYITRASTALNAGTALTFRLDNVVNPDTTDPTKLTFFVRIKTFASTDATGTAIDSGIVAASTSNQIVLTGKMPESLVFCTAKTIAAPGSIPDCSTATESAVTFNQLFSPTDTATATSQMAASTNASGGYSITVNGPTLKSGTNAVAAMSSRAAGARGTGQFGINLKLNTVATSTTPVGAEISLASNGTDRTGAATANYNVVDEFKFTTGEAIANSSGATNSQIYTVSYIVNVPGSQAAGEYTTTLTYICTPTF